MSNAQLEAAIEAAWDARDQITPATTGETREAIEDTLNALDSGSLRVAERQENGDWHVNQWAKKAVLLGFRLKDMEQQDGGPQGGHWWDKVDSKFKGWGDNEWTAAGFRAVPNCIVRKSAYVAPGVVLMPSFVNLGAYVDEGTMVDSHVLVGSCAQVGKHVHLSAGVQIGGVLEPIGQSPVVIEDNVFVGADAVIVEGIVVKARAVIAPSVVLSKGVQVYDCVNECVLPKGAPIPEGAVVVPGSRPIDTPWAREQGLSAACPVIVKYRDDKSDAALSLEEALR